MRFVEIYAHADSSQLVSTMAPVSHLIVTDQSWLAFRSKKRWRRSVIRSSGRIILQATSDTFHQKHSAGSSQEADDSFNLGGQKLTVTSSYP